MRITLRGRKGGSAGTVVTPTITPYGGSFTDFFSLQALLGRVMAADPDVPAAFARKALLDPNFDRQGLLLARDPHGEDLLGFALAVARKQVLEDGPDDRDHGYVTLFGVSPPARRQGLGRALFAAAEGYLRKRGCTSALVSPYAPNGFTPGVDVEAYPEALSFLAALGYAESERPLAMDLNLVGYRTPEWVRIKEKWLRNVSFSDFQPRHLTPLVDFLQKHFPGDWQSRVRGAITAILAGAPPERLWLAEDANGSILGFAQWEDERFGPFGVAQREQGRGIGAVLLDHALRAMRARGLHNAWFLWTDEKTAALFSGFGFRETRRFAVFRKAL